MGKTLFYCKRCKADKEAGCGMTSARFPVPYESGVRYERAACPLVPETRLQRILRKLGRFFT